MKDLIFRDKNDFFAGSWNLFKQFWLRFVAEYKDEALKDQLYSTLHYGVDTLSFSKHFTPENPARFRSTEANIVSVPIYDASYHSARAGDNHDKHLTSKKLFTRRRYQAGTEYWYEQPIGITRQKDIGNYPKNTI